MKLDIPTFSDRVKLFDFLKKNKSTIMAQKMNTTKHADACSSTIISLDLTKEALDSSKQSSVQDLLAKDEIYVKAVINTTNIMDSHNDVHLKGLWKKSLQENKRLLHVQEHKAHEFKSIIASGNDLKAYVKDMTWKELGFKAEGITQALIFESNVRKSRNSFMFDLYAKGEVTNHSVGMRYVKMAMAINDERYEEEYEEWNKNIDKVINKDQAERVGYFFPVYEAKAIEGSAVPLGSNQITPLLEVKHEPSLDTQTDENEAAEKALQERKNFIINL